MSLHDSACEMLDQIETVVRQLQPEEYRQPVSFLSNATLGQHIRHTLEFFLCLMDARNSGVVNYDQRKHDTWLETDPDFALQVIRTIKEFLRKENGDCDLVHQGNYSFSDDELNVCQTSFSRELGYTIEHTIHHLALIKIGLNQQFPRVELPGHFGVASSTVRFRKEQTQDG